MADRGYWLYINIPYYFCWFEAILHKDLFLSTPLPLQERSLIVLLANAGMRKQRKTFCYTRTFRHFIEYVVES